MGDVLRFPANGSSQAVTVTANFLFCHKADFHVTLPIRAALRHPKSRSPDMKKPQRKSCGFRFDG